MFILNTPKKQWWIRGITSIWDNFWGVSYEWEIDIKLTCNPPFDLNSNARLPNKIGIHQESEVHFALPREICSNYICRNWSFLQPLFNPQHGIRQRNWDAISPDDFRGWRS